MELYDVQTQPIREPKRTTPHLYVFPTGESVIENLANRKSRPHTEWKKLIPLILKNAGLSFKEIKQIKPSWSQKCGCSCGCSPGFKLKGAKTMKDVWADVQH